MASSDKDIEIAVLGATGFTGKLIAEYLSRSVPSGMSWAIAGRSRSKLEELHDSLRQKEESPVTLPIIIADVDVQSADPIMLNALCARTKVLIDTVGPFKWWGEPVVKACVQNHCDYCDITGEPEFVRDMMDRYGPEASQKGVLIVHCCGFDSIPADIGTLYTVDALAPSPDDQVTVECFLRVHSPGGPSHGTWTTLIDSVSNYSRAQGKKKQRSADVQLKQNQTQQQRRSSPSRVSLRPHWSNKMRAWAMPLPIADPFIVKRSAATAPQIYSRDFVFGEYSAILKWYNFIVFIMFMIVLFIMSQFSFTKNWLLKMRPPGSGPSEKDRETSWFEMTFFGSASNSDGSNKRAIVAKLSGGEPGYFTTSAMIGTVALFMLQERENLPHRGGVFTPAIGLGKNLIPKLQEHAGITFSQQSDGDDQKRQ